MNFKLLAEYVINYLQQMIKKKMNISNSSMEISIFELKLSNYIFFSETGKICMKEDIKELSRKDLLIKFSNSRN